MFLLHAIVFRSFSTYSSLFRSEMDESTNWLEAVSTYLERSDRMETLRSDCRRFSVGRAQPQTLYPFEVVVNTLDLLEENGFQLRDDTHGPLCHLLLKEPLKCQHLFKEAIYGTVRRRDWIPIENIGQVTVTLTVTRLPPLPSQFQMDSVADVFNVCWTDGGNPRLRRFQGTVVSLSTPSEYTLAASYSCSDGRCPSYSVLWNRRFTRIHVPGAREKQTVSDSFKCVSCGNKLKENVKDRVLAEKVIGEMVPLEEIRWMSDPRRGSSSFRAQSIPVYFRGEAMAKRVEIGHSYSIVALPVSNQWTGLERCAQVALEANYFEDITTGNQDEGNEGENDAVGSSLRAEMNRLLVELDIEDLASSPFVRPLLMAYYFAGGIAPRGLFLKAKLGILLCLVNNCGKDKRRASLLVVGRETSVIDRLLRYGASLAPRNVPLTTHTQLTVSTRHDTLGVGDDLLFVEANPILMATSGVCYLGDLAKFPNSSKRTITNILVTSTVSVDSKVFSGTPPPTAVPIECQLWAYHRGSNSGEQFFASTKNSNVGAVPKCLLDAFGLVYFVDFSTMAGSREKDEELANHCLNVAMGHSQLNDGDVQCHLEKFLEIVRDRDLKFESDAEFLIQGYFVASRRVRGVDERSSSLPLSAVLSITCAAEGHAKLCQRETVSEDDAIAAINLYEEFVTTSCEGSLLNIQPTPHSLGSDARTLFKKLISDMEQFGIALRRYVKAYSMDKMSQRSEE